jgi:hypothetical protein
MNRATLLVLTAGFAAGCGAEALTSPVIVRMENAQARDEYEAALATSESQGYAVVVSDPDHHALLLKAKPAGGKRAADDSRETGEAYLGVQALPGTVEIFVEQPAGHRMDPVEARVLGRQMEQLAGEIGQRTLIIGDPSPGTYAPPPLPTASSAL